MRYEFFQALQASLLPFRTDYPPADGFTIGRGLCAKKIPSCFIFFEDAVVRRRQIYASLLVRVDPNLLFLSDLVRFKSCWSHSLLFDQRLSSFDVHAAPDAARLARREPNSITQRVDALPNTIYPAIAKRFINRFGPRDAWFARILLVVADPY